jgi:hypothetical protein
MSVLSSNFLQEHLAAILLELFHRDPRQCPRAAALCQFFNSYCQVLNISIAETILEIRSRPCYEEWKELMTSSRSWESKLFYLFVNIYAIKRDNFSVVVVLKEMVGKYVKEGKWLSLFHVQSIR